MTERATDKLARYIITVCSIAIVAAVCWYFRDILIYIISASVLTLVGRPIYKKLTQISIKGHNFPSWIAALISMGVIFAFLYGLITMVIPIVGNVIGDISTANLEMMASSIAAPLQDLNTKLSSIIPNLGGDFRIEKLAIEQLRGALDLSTISSSVGSMVGSVASIITTVGVGLFSIVFITFFFMRDPKIFINLMLAFTPDRYESKMIESMHEIGKLISRYFIGLIAELLGVSLVNFLGLLTVAQMGFKYSIGIAFITGIFNIIPYVGPVIGGAFGIVLSLIIKYACATSFGISVGFPAFFAILLGIFVLTQLIDNYVFQPIIYSNSVKTHPLEIFIVFLIAGHIGGIPGMLVAIPGYTVARVFAYTFFGHIKAIRMLTGGKEQ